MSDLSQHQPFVTKECTFCQYHPSNCASEIAEVQLASAQQLKAEILPLVKAAISDLNMGHRNNVMLCLEHISAKLSAF